MTTFILILLTVLACAMSTVVGFIAGKGRINISMPVSKEERERKEKLMKRYEEQVEEYNAAFGNINSFGGMNDGL